MSSRLRLVAVVAGIVLSLTACDDHTVAIRFDPSIGDRWDVRSSIDTEVVRTTPAERTVDRSSSRLVATESVVDVAGDDIALEVSVARDGAAARTYEVRFDRSGRLSAIDLVEGVPVDTLGIDLASDLPPDVISPPDRPLEPGERWTIDRRVRVEGRDGSVRIRGTGRIDSLGVEDGRDVAVAVVEVEMPVRSVTDTASGRVTFAGSQAVTTRTAYDLADGTARREHTAIRGEIDVVVEPPEDIDAPPAPGSLHYDVVTETSRRRAR